MKENEGDPIRDATNIVHHLLDPPEDKREEEDPESEEQEADRGNRSGRSHRQEVTRVTPGCDQ